MPDKRMSNIDFGAGVMILWMIIGHAIYAATSVESVLGGISPVKNIGNYLPNFLFFFMPWFFYKSGQFFTKRDVREEWKMDWHKLMSRFFLWSAIGYCMYVIIQAISGTFTVRSVTYDIIRELFLCGAIQLNTPLWFLLTLFFVRQIVNILLPRKDDKYFWLKCAIIIFSGCTIAFGAHCLNHPLMPLWIGNGSAGVAFFTFGYCVHKLEMKKWLIIPCLLVYIACFIFGFPDVDMRTNRCGVMCMYLIYFPSCFAGIVTFNSLCRLISNRLHYVSVPFEQVGRHAMIIYVVHGLIFESIRKVCISMDIIVSCSYVFWIVLSAYLVILPLCCYFDKPPRRK